MTSTLRRLWTPILLSSLILLSACSDSGSSRRKSEVSISDITLNGTSAKGIIQFGIVSAFELDSAGNEVQILGSTLTDERGHYELALVDPPENGIIKISISANNNTLMKCDIFEGCSETAAFGDLMPLALGFRLNTIVITLPDQTLLNAPITPYTHMASAYALEQASAENALSPSVVDNSFLSVSDILGFDINNTPVLDITNPDSLLNASSEAQSYALFNSGIAKSILSDVNGQLAILASSYSDGVFDENDEFSLTALLSNVEAAAMASADNEALSALLEDGRTKTLTQIDHIQAGLPPVVGPDPGPGPGPGPAKTLEQKIAEAKNLLSQTRSFLQNISDNYDSPYQSIQQDIEAVRLQAESDAQFYEAILLPSVEANLEAMLNALEGMNIEETFNNISQNDVIAIDVSTTLYHPTSTTELRATTNLKRSQFLVTGDHVDLFVLPKGDSLSVTMTGSVQSGLSTADVNSLVATLTFDRTIAINSETDTSQFKNNIASIKFSGDIIFNTPTSAFSGVIDADFIPYEGAIYFRPYYCEPSYYYYFIYKDQPRCQRKTLPISLEKMALSGNFKNSTGELQASTTLRVFNAELFDIDWAYLYTNTLTYDYSEHEYYYPNFDDFEAISGYFLEGQISVSAKISTPEIPAALATVSLTREKEDTLEKGKLLTIVTFDNQTFMLSSDITKTDDQWSGQIELSNPSVKIIFDVDSQEGSIILAGTANYEDERVGVILTTDDGTTLIRYSDGSFESLY